MHPPSRDMEFPIVAFVALVSLVMTTGAAGLLVRAERARETLDEAWRRWAARRGWRFEAHASGPGSPRVVAPIDGLEVTAELLGDATPRRVRVSARVRDGATHEVLLCAHRHAPAQSPIALVRLDDPTFEARFELYARDPARAAAWWTPTLRQALVRVAGRWSLDDLRVTARDGVVELAWPVDAPDLGAVEDCVRLVARAASATGTGGAYR